MEYWSLHGTSIKLLLVNIPVIIALIFGIFMSIKIIRRSPQNIAKFLLLGCILLIVAYIVSSIEHFIIWQDIEHSRYNYVIYYVFHFLRYSTYVIGLLCLAYSCLGMFVSKRHGVKNVS